MRDETLALGLRRGDLLLTIIEAIESCLQSEKESRNVYYSFFTSLENEWISIFKNWKSVKEDRLLTKAFLRRVYLAYKSEELLGREINRKYQRSISSDVENIFGQMLKAFLLSQKAKNFSIEINSRVGDNQPDILVRLNKKPKIVIELKNDLGYIRNEWHEVMNKRLLSYKNAPDPIREDNFYVIILTVANWETKKMTCKEELKKWNGKKRNFVFLIKNPKIHPNPIKLSEHYLDKQDSLFDSLSSLDEVVTEPSLESVFETILSTLRKQV